MLGNAEAFRQFVADVRLGFARIRAGDQQAARRELHTIKGNFSVYGLSQLAASVHTLEDDETLSPAGVAAVEAEFDRFLTDHADVLGNFDAVSIPARLVEEAETRAAAARSSTDLRRVFLDFFRRIRQKPARALLGPIEDSFNQLATRLGKDATLEVRGADVGVPPSAQGVFRNLTHLLRNAIDHGLEQNAAGHVLVEITENDAGLVVSVADDGRGLDAEVLKRKATERRLISAEQASRMSEADAFELIFAAGFSTAESVTDISGRGVGMSAVKAAVEAAGGSLRVSSQRGRGTRFVIQLPKEQILAAA
jgi:two-component system chemotaxis sensor kinase CheA